MISSYVSVHEEVYDSVAVVVASSDSSVIMCEYGADYGSECVGAVYSVYVVSADDSSGAEAGVADCAEYSVCPCK